MAAASERTWAPGEEVDVQLEDGQWWPGAIVGADDRAAAPTYRVRIQGAAGGLPPPRGCCEDAGAQEEGGVTPGRLAPAGLHVPRWRMCGGGELVEVQVGGEWRRGRVFARYERRWFDAIIYIVDMMTRRVLISYLGWPKAPPNPRYGSLAEEWISFDSPRLRRPRDLPERAEAPAPRDAADDDGCGWDEGEWNVGDRAEVLVDQLEDDNRYVFWRYQGGYARGAMGTEDHPLRCTLGIDVLGAACPTCDGAHTAGAPCPPALGKASCCSSSDSSASSAGTADGGAGGPHGAGMRPRAVAGADAGEGGQGAQTIVYVKAGSADLAAPGTHLPVCTLKELGLDKRPAMPVPLLPPPSALAAAPLVALPPVRV